MDFPYLLCYAARWGDVETVRRLVDAGEKVDGKGHDSPLIWAAWSRRANIATLQALLELGADPRRELYYPSDEAKTRYLLESGMSPAHTLDGGLDLGVLRAFLEAGANPNIDGFALSRKAFYHHGAKGVRLLLDHGLDPASAGWGDLHIAAAMGTVEDVERALARGEWPQHPCPSGWEWHETPDAWSIALWVGDLAKLEAMRRAGADPLHLDGEDQTGLFLAAEANHPEVIRWLIDLDVPIDWPWDPFEKTALHAACERGSAYAAEVLIEQGALGSPSRNRNRLPWYWGATNIDIVRLLIENGVSFGDGAIDQLLTVAIDRPDDEFARELIAMTQYRNAPGNGGDAMAAAVREDERNIVRMMLDAGWNPNAFYDDVTPLYYARSPEVEEMLVRAGAKIIWSF